MKKILFVAVALVAMTFASCGGNKQAADAIDAEAVAQMTDQAQIQGAATQVVEALQAQIANSDKTQVEAIIAKAVEAAQGLINNGNVQGAATYVQTVTNFISENQEQLAAIGIDTSNLIPETVTDALSAATNVQQECENAASCAQEEANEAAQNVADEVQEAANQVVETAQQAANQAASQASQAAQEAVSNAAQQASEAAQQAIRRAIPGQQ